MTNPTISIADARDVCAKPWLTEAEAHEQALRLQHHNYRIEWCRKPVPFGTAAQIAARVYHPDPDHDPYEIGDITFRLETEL